jgi:ABC-type amino acid transport substrate-binding protein
MNDHVNDGKRDFLRTAAVLGAASGVLGAAVTPREAMAQMLETGIRDESSLAKVRKDGVLRVGYSQTGPWFYKDAKTGELGGIYKDAVDRLAKEMEVKVEWKEVTFQNSTVGLRRNDYDLYGSSLTYTLPRALVVDYVGPLWAKGSLVMVHKDNAGRFKKLSDFDDPKVTFSVVAGGSEEPRGPVLCPWAVGVGAAGGGGLAAEAGRAR